MQLELSERERDLLVEVLRGRLGELREEVYHATVSSYKDELKDVEARMIGLLERLGAGPESTGEAE